MDRPSRAARRAGLSATAGDLAAGLLARCLFPAPGTAVTCAVSGGADSLALLVLACAAGCEVTAAHVDHALRPGSAAEADRVAAAAARLGARFVAHRVTVPPGPNLEARARRARLAVLPVDALFGHTADDRAETMLLNLLRGSGAAGLAAGGAAPRRPIVALRRAETRALCAAMGLEPLQDPSNDDPAFRRNRVRAEVLPLLNEVAERDVVPLLVRLGEHLGDLEAFVAEQAAGVDPTDVAALRRAPAVVAAAALRGWLRQGSDDEHHPPDRATVERVLAVALGESRATDVGGGRRVTRSGGRLLLR